MDRQHPDGYGLRPGEGERIQFRGTRMTVKVSAEEGEAFSLIEMEHPPDVGPALHVHPGGSEAFYVLEGEYTVRCGDAEHVGGPGSFVLVPKGVPHRYRVGAAGGRVLVITPVGLERYFREVAEVLEAGPMTVAIEDAIARRHGQEFLDRLRHWGH